MILSVSVKMAIMLAVLGLCSGNKDSDDYSNIDGKCNGDCKKTCFTRHVVSFLIGAHLLSDDNQTSVPQMS